MHVWLCVFAFYSRIHYWRLSLSVCVCKFYFIGLNGNVHYLLKFHTHYFFFAVDVNGIVQRLNCFAQCSLTAVLYALDCWVCCFIFEVTSLFFFLLFQSDWAPFYCYCLHFLCNQTLIQPFFTINSFVCFGFCTFEFSIFLAICAHVMCLIKQMRNENLKRKAADRSRWNSDDKRKSYFNLTLVNKSCLDAKDTLDTPR